MKNIIYSKAKVVAMTVLFASPFFVVSCIEDNGNYEKAKNCYEYAASHGISDAEQKLKNMRYKKQIK